MKSLRLCLLAAWTLTPVVADAAVVEFRIPNGTGGSSWNSRETAVTVAVGDVLRIVNDDDVVHALHTSDGIPCEHGTDMAPRGGSYDCVIGTTYDPAVEGALFDHWFPEALFWVVAR